METYKVGFYKDVFEDGEFNFEKCMGWDATSAELAAKIFADYAFHNLDISDLGCDESFDIGYEASWGNGSYSIVVKEKNGNISVFSVHVSLRFNFNCNEIPM